MNKTLFEINESVTVSFADYVRNIEAQGKRIIKLQTGDPHFATHPKVIEAAREAMVNGHTHYASSSGIPELLDGIIGKLKGQNSIKARRDELLVTAGGVHGLFMGLTALLEKGDEVIVLEPHWMPYASIVRLLGGKVVALSLLDCPTEAVLLEKIRGAFTSKTKALILNSPSNPIGKVLSENFFKDLLAMISNTDAFLISDEVYERILYEGARHFSPGSLDPEKVISVYSFSKTYSMTGWRVGYVHASKKVTDEMRKVLQVTATCVSPFLQKAALVALTDPEVEEHVKEMVKFYEGQRNIVKELLPEVLLPSGAFYALIKVPHIQSGSFEFAKRLVEDVGVSLAPGIAFGKSFDSHLRFTFAIDREELVQGLTKVASFFAS